MTKRTTKSLRNLAAFAPLALALSLGGCFDDDDDDDDMVVEPTATPTPTPPPMGGVDVGPCLEQTIPGTGTTVAGAVVPDTLTLNLGAPSGFPNGRTLPDPVIDVTLAVIFLDLSVHSPTTFFEIPLNPPANDVAFRSGFPFLAAPQGSPPVNSGGGSMFTFRTDSSDAYVRVDRMGMPAVATALIGTDQKVPYNDANPAADANGQFVPELVEQLTGLTEALADDLAGAGLTPCASTS